MAAHGAARKYRKKLGKGEPLILNGPEIIVCLHVAGHEIGFVPYNPVNGRTSLVKKKIPRIWIHSVCRRILIIGCPHRHGAGGISLTYYNR